MAKIYIDNSGISKLLDVLQGRKRKIARLFFVNGFTYEQIAEQLGVCTHTIATDFKSINETINKHLIVRTCDCGRIMYCGNNQTKICDKCRDKNKININLKSNEPPKNSKPKCTKQKSNGITNVHTIISRMIKYNKKYNTNYDYGYYVLKVGE